MGGPATVITSCSIKVMGSIEVIFMQIPGCKAASFTLCVNYSKLS